MIYDVIVIGVGSMGASACYHLAKRGAKVLGLEQFSVAHEQGSHTGQSRLIRRAYFEHQDYIPLLTETYRGWREIEKASGERLYHDTGIAYFGPDDDPVMVGIRDAAKRFDITLDQGPAVIAAHPQFRIPSDFSALFEPDAGFLTPEKGIRTLAKLAKSHGAVIKSNCRILDWKVTNGMVEVFGEGQRFKAGKLVLTAGAFTRELLRGIAMKLTVTRQLLAWFQCDAPEVDLGAFPCWMISEPDTRGVYYGFPKLPSHFDGPAGLKLAYHAPGALVDPRERGPFDPIAAGKNLREVASRFLTMKVLEPTEMKECLYTYTPDEHFIIDRLPGYEAHVAIACGFSGHGYKFVPAVGCILSDLTLDGRTPMPIDFLNARRFLERV